MGARKNSDPAWTRKGSCASWNLRVRTKDGMSMEANNFGMTPKSAENAAWRDNFAFALWMLMSFGGPTALRDDAEPEVIEFNEAVKVYEAAAKKYEQWCDTQREAKE